MLQTCGEVNGGFPHRPQWSSVTGFLVDAAHLFLGAVCAVCGAPGWGACSSCRRAIARVTPHQVRRPGLNIPLIAANDYRPQLEKLVPVFKDDGALQLSALLARRLALAVGCLDAPRGTWLVPVPSLASAVRRRGMDHGAMLAAAAARQLGLPWRAHLTRDLRGLDQRSLGASGRQLNVAGSMRARRHPGTVIIVDDVCTTGASLVEAVRALQLAGAIVLGGAVIGDADRHFDTPTADFHPGRSLS